MPRLRFQKASAEKREALLDAATYEFAANGYEDASISRILLAAGFSKGSFYYYFDDKTDLAVAVLERWVTRHMNLWDDLPVPRTTDEFWKFGEALMERGTARLREEPHTTTDAMMRLGTALSRDADVRERLTSATVAMMSKVTAVWQRGQEIGALRSDLSVADLMAIVQDVKLTLVRRLLPNDRAAMNDEIDAFARVHFDLVRRITEKR